jgi:hypothetical protein
MASFESSSTLQTTFMLMLRFFLSRKFVAVIMRSPALSVPAALGVPGGQQDRSQGLNENGAERREQDDREDCHGEDLFAPGQHLGGRARLTRPRQEHRAWDTR